ncbi:MAG: M1 family aminopeptidase [Acidobacteriota bacterium]
MRKSSVIALISIAAWFLAIDGRADVAAYRALRDAKPDGRVVRVNNFTLEKDAYKFTFRSGAFHFLAPAESRTFGAVFIGDGSFVLTPATENERRHLDVVLNDPQLEVLTDTFDSMVFLFTDQTADEIQKHAAMEKGAPDPRAIALYADYLEQQKKKFQINLHLRILEDLLNQPGPGQTGVFLAVVDGKKLAPALLAVDPLGIGNLGAGLGFFGGETTAFLSIDESNGGVWYLSARRGEAVNGRGKPLPLLVDATHYDVDTTIASNSAIEGLTTIHLRPRLNGVRMFPVQILPKLRIKEATILVGGKRMPLEVVQEEIELGKLARLFHEEAADANAALILPSALPMNSDSEVAIRYEGRDVLRAIGESYSVRARESWYPNLGTFTDLATYSMTYRFPKKMTLVSSGKMVSQSEEKGQQISKWQSDLPLRVIGFNYGKFEKISENDAPSGLKLDVYTQRDFQKMARDTMADAQNTARVATLFFGAAPYPQVAVTQQAEWNFGQSWPSLVFLPTLALTTSTERVAMFDEAGPAAMYGANEFAKTVGWHEMAHQWWGHMVGWESYRDQWLSEGFAEFTAALVLQATENNGKYYDFWDRKRENILQKSRRGTVSNNDSGPVSEGFRLSTKASPGASSAIVYEKGAYVLYMLRMLFRDPTKPDEDAAFKAMMHDFVTSYTWKNPSTADFQRVVEAHMTRPMDIAGNRKMDYFFKQWVDGTDVPKIKSDLRFDAIDGKKYRLSGSVSQEAVPNDFLTLVPIYIEFADGNMARIGAIRLTGLAPQSLNIELALPQAPKRVLVNAHHDVLSR